MSLVQPSRRLNDREQRDCDVIGDQMISRRKNLDLLELCPVSKKGYGWNRARFDEDRGLYQFKNVLKWTSYLVPLASKTSLTESYEKPSRAQTRICSPCCAIFACSRLGTWDLNFVIQMSPWITNLLLLVNSSQKARVGAQKARQWVCPRFISVVCGALDYVKVKGKGVLSCDFWGWGAWFKLVCTL